MAGWSILTDGSALDCVDVHRNLQSNGFCLDLDSSLKSGGKDEPRCLFDQILYLFLKEISVSEDIRPLPAMLGDGRCVDLFKLFLAVRKKGGYDSASKNGLWGSVAEEFGLCSGVGSSLKLIYIKYLDTLDRWLQRILRDGEIGAGGLLPDELETEFRGFLIEMSDQKKKNEEYPPWNLEKNVPCLLAAEKMYNTHQVIDLTDQRYIDDDGDEVAILEPNVVNEDAYFRKRKRESLSGMLNWVTEIAKNPSDLAIETLPGSSEWKVGGVKEFWGKALLARDALFLRRHDYSSAEQSLLQKRQKMHPSICEAHISDDHQSTERLRCSRRIVSLKNPHSRFSSESSSATQIDLDMSLIPFRAGLENHYDKRPLVTAEPLIASTGVGPFGNDHLQKQVPVGPLFQAEVPDWMGVASESDCKWFGTKIWTLEMGECTPVIEKDPIGKGRQDSCGCCLPGSVECVRFHIAEKRMRLKLELGIAFYRWRFDCMGEEVSLSWTEEEEKRFKAIVRLNPPSLHKSFWDQIFMCFPTKSRKNLVSYYFNVFLLRRRSYQNRVSPNNIDSDDDESEFGSVSNGFGHEAVKVPGSKFIFCAQNKQCIDLEDHTEVD